MASGIIPAYVWAPLDPGRMNESMSRHLHWECIVRPREIFRWQGYPAPVILIRVRRIGMRAVEPAYALLGWSARGRAPHTLIRVSNTLVVARKTIG